MTSPGPLVPGDPARLGRYELVGRLGEGGQSVVYLGRREDGVRAAVKLLRDQLSRSPEWRARFEREMRMIGRVAGFCTAQVVDADISGDLPYVVSEYVPGPSLSGLVNEQGPRIGTDLDRLAIGTVTALAAIHRAGILHRDFKPSNVLMGPDGPRVIDFGIARVIGTASARGSGVVGTPSYMAPEQVTDAELGSGVDMFTWAATMLFAATGRHPFGNDTISAVFHRILNYEPDLSPLPESLRGVVASCLAKDPALRPGGAGGAAHPARRARRPRGRGGAQHRRALRRGRAGAADRGAPLGAAGRDRLGRDVPGPAAAHRPAAAPAPGARDRRGGGGAARRARRGRDGVAADVGRFGGGSREGRHRVGRPARRGGGGGRAGPRRRSRRCSASTTPSSRRTWRRRTGCRRPATARTTTGSSGRGTTRRSWRPRRARSARRWSTRPSCPPGPAR
ncbi:serine/threonine-protein kinase [Actinomadura madurae]|uniref:serine/threonine-protein kinase n=1 Tax=Actinomadura madurae TaxID=1993 RepID=UPI0020D227AE|nr:serine/threonine-protein kinase [Actinomadura madurae]MCP9971132.1 serine/threonine protein kinase [Actinomadura madurae]MCQ0004820.1 serine/threonine protein kinase [Actinomadura madurae]MCQ0019853.1 serine/threonine protein kinase [Actinomadura madurae]